MAGIQKHAFISPSVYSKPEPNDNSSGINRMKAILVDDDPNSHVVLKELLSQNHPKVNILASGYSVSEGIELIKVHNPDLVFLDIELPDGLGFDILKEIGSADFYVIFITAFKQYAVTAIKFGGLDYLVKPISFHALSEAFKILQKRQQEDQKKQLQIVRETLERYPEKRLPSLIAIPSIEEITFIEVGSVMRLEADGPCTVFIRHNEKKKIVASRHLGYYEKMFEPYSQFMKVHRKHLINLEYVQKFVKVDGGYIVMKDGATVTIPGRYREEFLTRLSFF